MAIASIVWGPNVKSEITGPQFAPIPSNPSSIVITKFIGTNVSERSDSSSYTLTGQRMESVFKVLQQDSRHTLPQNWSASCPNIPRGTVAWNYDIVVRYPNHSERSFTQTAGGCTVVEDRQTGAMAFSVDLSEYLRERSRLGIDHSSQ